MLTPHRVRSMMLIAASLLAGTISRPAHAGFLTVTADAVRTDATDIDISASFEGLEAQTFSFGPPNVFPLGVTFTVLNGTGIDWTDFTISIVASGVLELSTAAGAMMVDSYTFFGGRPGLGGVLVPAGNTFTIPTDTPFSSLRILNPENVASIDVRLVPSIAIPEPSSLTLVGIGTLSLLGYAWRRRKRATA
jgi:hypothetical protein